MYGEKAEQLVQHLRASGIVGAEGEIKLELLGTEVNVSDTSAIGNLLQEWLGQWMALNGVYFRVNTNTQMFPDFYLGEDDKKDLLEVKTFNYVESPNFDIANFDAYIRSLRDSAYKLDSDYLIMGYSLSKGVIKINDIWLKKVWEITCPSTQYAIRSQVKQNKIVNIRPYNFKSMPRGFKPFDSRLKFVTAIKKTLKKYLHSISKSEEWFTDVERSYMESNHTAL